MDIRIKVYIIDQCNYIEYSEDVVSVVFAPVKDHVMR